MEMEGGIKRVSKLANTPKTLESQAAGDPRRGLILAICASTPWRCFPKKRKHEFVIIY